MHYTVTDVGGNGIILSPAVLSSRWKLTRNPHTSFDYDNCSCPTSGLKNLLFDMPEDCIFQVEKLQNAPNSVIKYETATLDRIWSTLNKEGIVLVKCHWRQNSTLRALPECSTSESHETKMFSSEINAEMIDFISQMGGIPHSHTLEGPEEQVWDVKPYFKAARTKTCDNVDLTPPPRSHTSDEFGMHTDCSFEDPPPRFVALYVVQEDTFGGGYTTLIDTDALNRYLSRKSLLVFKNRDFTVTVPPEFFKGVKHITLKLITAKEKLWSYRSDIVRRDLCDEEQRNALDELDGLLSNPSLILTTMLPTGAMLLLDNMRWFHGRSSIMDSRRWLKRVRFQPSPSRIPPALNRLVSRSDSCPADDKIV